MGGMEGEETITINSQNGMRVGKHRGSGWGVEHFSS